MSTKCDHVVAYAASSCPWPSRLFTFKDWERNDPAWKLGSLEGGLRFNHCPLCGWEVSFVHATESRGDVVAIIGADDSTLVEIPRGDFYAIVWPNHGPLPPSRRNGVGWVRLLFMIARGCTVYRDGTLHKPGVVNDETATA